MHVVCGGHFWQFGSIASLTTETTDGGLFWPKHGPNDLRVPNFKNFHGGACPQTSQAYSHTHVMAVPVRNSCPEYNSSSNSQRFKLKVKEL